MHMRCCSIAATFCKMNPMNHNQSGFDILWIVVYRNYPELGSRPDISYIGISYIGNFSGIYIDHPDVGGTVRKYPRPAGGFNTEAFDEELWLVALS